MLIGHVSDERDLALAGVEVELTRAGDDAPGAPATAVRSTASGAIHADVPPGEYRIVLARDGFGPKHVVARVAPQAPLRLRLLSDRLTGFVWPKWSRAAEQAELRLHAPEPIRAELWRYGLRKERVELLGWFDDHGPRAMAQILPDGDFSQTGVDWNRHGYSSPGHVRRVAAPQRSGLYYVHAETPSGGFFAFPWVVAPAAPQARIAVLAATMNWNAYNNFGGRSNYVNADGLPATPTVNARLDLDRYRIGPQTTQAAPNDAYPPLSYERPELDCHVERDTQAADPMSGRLASTLAPGLWRLLAWLEREGYAYDLYSDQQLHDGTLDLDAYDALLTDAHPEYWSRAMYERTRDWVFERGGRLVYLGGNGVDCEVEPVGDGAARYLTQQPDPDDPADAGLESRFHRTVAPQSELLGVTFTHAGEGTAAPYEALAPDHWAFAGTGLGAGGVFGANSLQERIPGGASGHETDKRTASSPDDLVMLARGLNADGGGAEMVWRDVPGAGGEVFSSGSITWIATLLVDPATSRITANVLDRFAPGARA